MKDLLDAATGLDADAVEQRARQVLAEPLYWFPVRHHSPTAARYLAEVLRARWPSIKVLYTSGYMDDEVAERIGTLAKATFLQKPYTSAILLRRVREVLDGAPVSP